MELRVRRLEWVEPLVQRVSQCKGYGLTSWSGSMRSCGDAAEEAVGVFMETELVSVWTVSSEAGRKCSAWAEVFEFECCEHSDVFLTRFCRSSALIRKRPKTSCHMTVNNVLFATWIRLSLSRDWLLTELSAGLGLKTDNIHGCSLQVSLRVSRCCTSAACPHASLPFCVILQNVINTKVSLLVILSDVIYIPDLHHVNMTWVSATCVAMTSVEQQHVSVPSYLLLLLCCFHLVCFFGVCFKPVCCNFCGFLTVLCLFESLWSHWLVHAYKSDVLLRPKQSECQLHKSTPKQAAYVRLPLPKVLREETPPSEVCGHLSYVENPQHSSEMSENVVINMSSIRVI